MPRTLVTCLALATGGALLIAASLAFGPGDLADLRLRDTLIDLRAARVVASALAGAALAVAGVAAQGLFRNPLVSPSILGTTSGAMLGGQLALLLFVALPGRATAVAPALVLPLGCLVGAWASLLLLLLFLRRGADNLTLLLTGFILSGLFLSLGGFATSLAQESWQLGRAVVSFVLGGVSGVGWGQILLVVPLVLVGIAATWSWSPTLDVLLSGEAEAQSLGVDVTAARRWLTVWIAVLTAAAVSLGGNVAFVGLIVPHVLRRYVGALHGALVPAAALGGAIFVLASDLVVRLLPTRGEIPLGVITGVVGAPLFLVLLARQRRGLLHV